MSNKHEEVHMHHHEDGSCCNHENHVEKHEEHTHDHQHHEGDKCCGGTCEASENDDGEIDSQFKYKIVGLDCANCARKVEEHLNKQDYIEEAKLNFVKEFLYINPSKKIKKDELEAKLLKNISEVESGITLVDSESDDVETSLRGEVIHLIIGIVLFVVALLLEDKVSIPAIYIYLVPYLVVGYPVLYKSFRNILKGEIFDENFLMSIATIGAFVVNAYEEAVAVMLFYMIGETFQAFAVNRSRKSIADLMDIKSDVATLIKEDGSEVQVNPKQLKVNDIISIKTGEKVALDGVIVEGNASLDVVALTGETALRDVGVNDQILAGSINTNGLLKMKVEKVYEDSTVAKILDLVENASNKKAPIENFITKFAKVYTPIVVFLAVALVLIPTLIYGTDDFYTWLYRGCTFLVISCPCALVVSIPLGVFAGIGSASRVGALIKGGNYLELLRDVNCVVFDKTGTITKGNFEVSEIKGASDTLMYGAYAEWYSNHPISRSIVNAYDKEIDTTRLKEYQELAGFGVKVLLDDKVLLAGNEKLLMNNKIAYEPIVALGSVVYIAYDGELIGSIIIRDEIKQSSKQAIAELKNLGIKETVMLSGDREAIANDIARNVGISKVHAELLPQDKVTKLEEYLNNPAYTVAFVGDGINDAPSLVRSDIGISMGGIGSDVAIEASDIVLMNDDLRVIPKTINISRKTKRILMQNIIFALGVKTFVLILTAIGYATMWMGVFADVGVTLIAIINAMRILRIK